jgi:uncharacterized protein (DUF488 family)
MSMQPVRTIGHSTHPLETFVSLLEQHGTTAVADVRSVPFSRFNPQFNRDALERGLMQRSIRYAFLGRELGARSDDLSCYQNGRVRYDRLARTELFRTGVERVARGAAAHRIVLLCAEKEPLECHRAILVAPALVDHGCAVEHILADGSLESHDAAMRRLLDIWGLPHHDLFRSPDQLIAEALARQEERIAFVDEKLTDRAAGESL